MIALRKLLVLAAVAALAGCASGGGMARLDSGSSLHADSDYMYAVESIARHKGVDVVWINPPDEDGVDYSKAAFR